MHTSRVPDVIQSRGCDLKSYDIKSIRVSEMFFSGKGVCTECAEGHSQQGNSGEGLHCDRMDEMKKVMKYW